MAVRRVLVLLSLALAAAAAPNLKISALGSSRPGGQCLQGLPQHVRTNCIERAGLSPSELVPFIVQCLRTFSNILSQNDIAAREQCIKAELAAPTTDAVAVHLQLMYESKCPDSITFIKEQLAPTYATLGSQLIVVDFIPYGIAKTVSNGSEISFTCQHGASECLGNKLQACGLARLGNNAKQVAFVSCVMSETDPSNPGDKCFTDVGLERSEVLKCATGSEGDVLHAGMGFRTMHPVPWVPRITLNGIYSQEVQDHAEESLLPSVCAKLAQSERPAACAILSTPAPSSSSTLSPVPTAAPTARAQSVLVQVMYEALCPYSIQLIKEQVAPTFAALGPQLMIVDLVPYGKSQTSADGNGYKFTCQHGPNECIGNMLQTCGLTRLSDNRKQVEFVNCVMSSKDPSKPDDKCVTDAGLDPSDMTACETGLEGQVLQAGMGFRTLPHIPFVPRISFNGVFDDQDQDNGQENLLLVVCEKLAQGVRPAMCQGTPSAKSTSPPKSTPRATSTPPPSPPPKPSSSSFNSPSLLGVIVVLLCALRMHQSQN